MSFLYFFLFEAGNCVSNSSFEWMQIEASDSAAQGLNKQKNETCITVADMIETRFEINNVPISHSGISFIHHWKLLPNCVILTV